ncbi:hypothetical protein NL492_26225, partial [Klebsiella pneumoniae]|nr:hypothetical protein [Klebsiella pneumoniae]
NQDGLPNHKLELEHLKLLQQVIQIWPHNIETSELVLQFLPVNKPHWPEMQWWTEMLGPLVRHNKCQAPFLLEECVFLELVVRVLEDTNIQLTCVIHLAKLKVWE